MKKFVLASAMALASIAFVSSPMLRAQNNSDQITISNPAEFNDYQNATTQTNPAAKAQALEEFLTRYPNSVVKKAVLDQLVDAYQASGNSDKALDAAKRLLQVDPNNFKAIFFAVFLDKQACQKSIDPSGDPKDPQACDDAAALAQKGLTMAKPEGSSDADWKTMTTNAYPVFHSAIGYDDLVAKKDYKDAIQEYTKELMLFPPDACNKPGQCLADTLQLAQSYAKPGDTRDEVKAIWFYARAWDYAPPAFKAQIEPQLEYWYKRYHGTLDTPQQITQQISSIKTEAQGSLFPSATYSVAPAPSPADLAHRALTSGDPKNLNLEDKEFILANGSQADAQQLWSLLQGQLTPVPGIVISDPATVLTVSVSATAAAKPKDYVVKLMNPVSCDAVPPPPSDLKTKEAADYLQTNGVAADVSAIEGLDHAHKIVIEPSITAIKVAVTQDAKDTKSPDFTVNLKDPLSCKDAPAADSQAMTQPNLEIDGTYSTYTTTPAKGSTAAKAEIVLTDGFVQQEKKEKAPVHHAVAHHTVHRGM